jgi:hypothetical protein
MPVLSPKPAQPGTHRHLLERALDEPVLGAHLCYPAKAFCRPISTTALRLARRLAGRSGLTDRVPQGTPRHAVLAVTPSRVTVWEARFAARFAAGGLELGAEIGSWRHEALTFARSREEIVITSSDGDGHSRTSRTKMLRYRFGTPDGELAVDIPAGRGPAAELDRALVAALGRGRQ